MATPLHGSVRMDVDADLSAVPDGARSLEQAVRGAVNTLVAGLGEAAAGRKYLEKVEAWARGANYTAKRLPALPQPICKAGRRRHAPRRGTPGSQLASACQGLPDQLLSQAGAPLHLASARRRPSRYDAPPAAAPPAPRRAARAGATLGSRPSRGRKIERVGDASHAWINAGCKA